MGAQDFDPGKTVVFLEISCSCSTVKSLYSALVVLKESEIKNCLGKERIPGSEALSGSDF